MFPFFRARLSDGTYSDKLIYMYKENGSRRPNAVCRCQHGNGGKKKRACDPSDHQGRNSIHFRILTGNLMKIFMKMVA